MDYTATYSLPYPELTDPPYVSSNFNVLAGAIDEALYSVDELPNYALGIIAGVRRTSFGTEFNDTAWHTSLSIASVSFVAGRAYRITAPNNSFAAFVGYNRLEIQQLVGATRVGHGGIELANANAAEATTVIGYYLPAVDTTTSVSLQFRRTSGTNGVLATGYSDWPSYLYVEDIGVLDA